MNQAKKQISPKSIRLGWQSRKGLKPQKLSEIVGRGVKIETGMFGYSTLDNAKLLIP